MEDWVLEGAATMSRPLKKPALQDKQLRTVDESDRDGPTSPSQL